MWTLLLQLQFFSFANSYTYFFSWYSFRALFLHVFCVTKQQLREKQFNINTLTKNSSDETIHTRRKQSHTTVSVMAMTQHCFRGTKDYAFLQFWWRKCHVLLFMKMEQFKSAKLCTPGSNLLQPKKFFPI